MSDETRIPIGEVEDQRLEFKAAAALEKPERIAREVVGMLNADGGQVWIGLREEEGRAVGADLIPAVERARERLHDSLVDSLSPSPDHRELKIEVVPLPDSKDQGILRITVQPRAPRRPYALVSGASHTFVVRVGSRLRPMERQEIFKDLGSGEGTALQVAKEQIDKEKERIRSEKEPVLWLRVQPVPAIEIDPQDEVFERLVSRPARSGNRDVGWHFANSQYRPRVSVDRVTWGEDTSAAIRVVFESSGSAEFRMSLTGLEHKNEAIWPLALIEYPVSGLRIVQQVYENLLSSDAKVIVVLALFHVGERGLIWGSPNDFRFDARGRHTLSEDEATAELVLSASDLLENPDLCGFRLLRLIYQSFGIREEDMPREFDRKTGRLILPE